MFVQRCCAVLSPTFAIEKEIVAHEKEVGLRVFFLTKGICEHVLTSKHLTVGYYSPGSYFGELSPLTGQRRPLTFRALTRMELLHNFECHIFNSLNIDKDST